MPPRARASFPAAVLLAGLAVTAVATDFTRQTATANDRLRFENSADAVAHEIHGRLDAYIAMLRGGAGLFAASDEVQLSEFRSYVQRLELEARYPGIRGIGFSRIVRPPEREDVARMVRASGLPFRYWPEPVDDEVHAIVFLEPMDERNEVALGYNMRSEAVRRDAMDRARDTGAPAASGRVRLVQELVDPANEQWGFLIYLPVYHTGTMPSTVEERRLQLFGFVYSPFRADDLLRGIVPRDANPAVVYEVHDGPPSAGQLLHRSAGMPPTAPFEVVRTADVAGREWTLVMRPGSGFHRSTQSAVLAVIGVGLLMTGLLFMAIRTQARARLVAERTAEELRQSEEALRAANRAKDEFLAVISHELRTPLNAIIGWASMLRKGQLTPERQAHALDVIQRNAAAQTMLVEDLLDISRAVAGRLRLEIATTNVAEVVKAAIDALRPAAEARGVTLVGDENRDLGTIQADPARLQQIVLNLVSNGIKFTPEGGKVTVSAERTATRLTLRVSDTGIGIAPEFLPQVFERFRQADSSTTRAHTGVGLGLAIARHLVELHRGTISVASEGLNRGATFTVTLPVG